MSALLVALLAYSAVPHFHAEDHAVASRYDAGAVEDARLLADEAHDSHSSALGVDPDPCALCRGASARILAATPPELFRLEACESGRCERFVETHHAELLLAEHHPARAPPRA